MADTKAKLTLNGDTAVELDVLKGTLGQDVIDIRTLGSKGVFTFDPGFTSTASCESKITFIDGDEGILLHRGFPIDQLATDSNYLEVCYILLNGEKPTQEQYDEFKTTVTRHTMIDLYYRLNVLTLNLPPLRDCPQDIMPLTELFVARFADEQGVPRPKLAADLNTVLTRYAWPGNVRQLKNAIYRALTQLDGYELRPQDILLPDYDAATVAVGEDAMEGSLDEITSRFERSVLTQLYRNYPSTRKLAKRLGVSHTAIANKLREYGLSQKKNEE